MEAEIPNFSSLLKVSHINQLENSSTPADPLLSKQSVQEQNNQKQPLLQEQQKISQPIQVPVLAQKLPEPVLEPVQKLHMPEIVQDLPMSQFVQEPKNIQEKPFWSNIYFIIFGFVIVVILLSLSYYYIFISDENFEVEVKEPDYYLPPELLEEIKEPSRRLETIDENSS